MKIRNWGDAGGVLFIIVLVMVAFALVWTFVNLLVAVARNSDADNETLTQEEKRAAFIDRWQPVAEKQVFDVISPNGVRCVVYEAYGITCNWKEYNDVQSQQ